MRRKKCVSISACVAVFLYYFFGIGDYLFSKNFDDEFNYPLNINLQPVVDEILAGKAPRVTPINIYPYRYLSTTTQCSNVDKIDLLIMVKSAIEHFDQRKAIRLTYGREHVPNKVVKLIFFLGIHRNPDPNVRKSVVEEREEYSDVIQMDFEDNYYNMTIKTMMSFRWAYEHCPLADYYLFTDDDMYISVTNVLKFVEFPSDAVPDSRLRKTVSRSKAYERHLIAGYVFKSTPQRFWTSKWRVSLSEYPWNRWPAYVTAGAYVVSNRSMKAIHVASNFVKHFRFDDIYLGIVAKKLGIQLTHSEHFHFYKKRYTRDGYKDVIASHGYGDPDELISVWNDQNVHQYFA